MLRPGGHVLLQAPLPHEGDDRDVDDLVAGADAGSLTGVADGWQAQARRHAFQFVTFHCRKPG